MRLQAMCVVVLVWTLALVSAASSLMIKEEPQGNTELYVAPVSYSRKDGKSLPSTIIISRPLGIQPYSKDRKHPDIFSIVSEEEDSGEDGLHLKPNIKFYKIECKSGRSCTSIIPARSITFDKPTAKPFTDEDIKKYLKQFSLRDGFPYDDDYESSGTPKEPKESQEMRHIGETDDSEHHTQRAFSSPHFNRPGFWPRPSKGQVFKYEQYDPDELNSPPGVHIPVRNPSINWDKISETFPKRSPTTEWQRVRPFRPGPQHSTSSYFSRPHQSSRPYLNYHSNDDRIHFPYDHPRPSSVTTARAAPYDGVWKRYSMSTVSQHDKDTGEWVKISMSNTELDQGVFKKHPDALRESTHHAKASLTVLGLSEQLPPSSFSGRLPQGTHLMEVPNTLPGRPPALIETDGSKVATNNRLSWMPGRLIREQ
nr:uncharacterized protein LOC128696651 [Cherax quadricarinatus]